MAHQTTIGADVFDRWATFYIFEHLGKKYACVWKVLVSTMMTEEEAVMDGEQKVKDEFDFDEKKTLKFIERARRDHDRKVREYDQRCRERAEKGIEKKDRIAHSKMDEVVLRSSVYEGELEVGSTFIGMATVVDTTSNSVRLRLYRVTRYGRTCLQWFTQEAFNKRFRETMEQKENRWFGIEAMEEEREDV